MSDTVIEGYAAEQLEALASINAFEMQATTSELEASDLRYEQAAKVVAALKGGLTQRQVADGWKRADGSSYDQSHVSRTAKVHRLFYDLSHNRPLWNEAYNSDEVRGKEDGSQLNQQSITNEWYTPPEYIEAARATLGTIDLDPASNPEANETVQAAVFYTEDDDGLGHGWAGNVWLNPPYGGLAKDFINRLVDEYEARNVTAAVILVNAHTTDTSWFQRLWDHTLCFTDHRINFEAGTEKRSGSTHGSVFVYLGPAPKRFKENFDQFGAVVERLT